MALREEFERSGNWLFHRRGHLPVLLLLVVMPALVEFESQGDGCAQDLWEAACLALALAGLGIRAAVVGYAPPRTSGRDTREQVAETLNTSGLYSVVRHPLYLGNSLMWLGVTAFPGAWWCPVIGSLAFWLYYERIMFAEEEYLRRRFGETWLEWASRTPAFVPNLRGWSAPCRSFSIRSALRGEYSSLSGLVASLTLLDVLGNVVHKGRIELDPVWGGIFGCAVVAHIVLRTLKRKTKLLHIDGR